MSLRGRWAWPHLQFPHVNCTLHECSARGGGVCLNNGRSGGGVARPHLCHISTSTLDSSTWLCFSTDFSTRSSSSSSSSVRFAFPDPFFPPDVPAFSEPSALFFFPVWHFHLIYKTQRNNGDKGQVEQQQNRI